MSEPYDPKQPRINDRCPSCGSRSLFIGAGGLLTCSVIGCREPGVGAAIVAKDAEIAALTEKCERQQKANLGLVESLKDMENNRDALQAKVARLEQVGDELLDLVPPIAWASATQRWTAARGEGA